MRRSFTTGEVRHMTRSRNGAELLVQCLETQGVKYIFGIPGAKVDTIFDVLADHGPRLILCRHEQNAAFMAGLEPGDGAGTPGSRSARARCRARSSSAIS